MGGGGAVLVLSELESMAARQQREIAQQRRLLEQREARLAVLRGAQVSLVVSHRFHLIILFLSFSVALPLPPPPSLPLPTTACGIRRRVTRVRRTRYAVANRPPLPSLPFPLLRICVIYDVGELYRSKLETDERERERKREGGKKHSRES